ncbi:MAG: apolipoprotein N-acyltransferase, partial [Rhodospirillales bacterium]
WWFGFGHFAAGLYWIGLAFMTFPDRFGWMAPFAVIGLAAGLAVFPAFAAALLRLSGTFGVGRILVFSGLWTFLEWLRGWVFTGFPWNPMGSAWVVSDAMIQLAALTGVFGLSLLTVTVAAMPAVLADGEEGSDMRRELKYVSAAVLVLGAVWAGGALRLAGAVEGVQPGVVLRLVQPNIDQRLKWRSDLRSKHVERQLTMSGKSADPPPTHIIWAETAAPFYLAEEAEIREVMARAVPVGGYIITGAPRITPKREKPLKVYNSLHAIDGNGNVAATYDKFHLVPFGEYVPFKDILGLSKITEGSTGFTPGTGPLTIRLAGLPPFSPLICYEVIFPGRVTDPNDRPSWLLNITNDAWYGDSPGPHQHFAAARLRAVEEGLPLVRVANTGISGIIDAYGRTVARLELGQEGILDGALPVRLEGPTLYARMGDWIALAAMAVVCGAGMAMGARKPTN